MEQEGGMTNREALAKVIIENAVQILCDEGVNVSQLQELFCDLRPGDCEEDYHGNCKGCIKEWLDSPADERLVYEIIEGYSLIRPAREGDG